MAALANEILQTILLAAILLTGHMHNRQGRRRHSEPPRLDEIFSSPVRQQRFPHGYN